MQKKKNEHLCFRLLKEAFVDFCLSLSALRGQLMLLTRQTPF